MNSLHLYELRFCDNIPCLTLRWVFFWLPFPDSLNNSGHDTCGDYMICQSMDRIYRLARRFFLGQALCLVAGRINHDCRCFPGDQVTWDLTERGFARLIDRLTSRKAMPMPITATNQATPAQNMSSCLFQFPSSIWPYSKVSIWKHPYSERRHEQISARRINSQYSMIFLNRQCYELLKRLYTIHMSMGSECLICIRHV